MMKYLDHSTIELNGVLADDETVLHAARVSTLGDISNASKTPEPPETEGLINYLMKHRHGTPFEHTFFRFFVHAPIFVWREWHRHRLQSYNEESARYKTLDPVFYLPPGDRPMIKINDWKPGRPKFLLATPLIHSQLCQNLRESYKLSYSTYLANLEMGIDPGLARDCLPVGIFSSCWVSCNARSLMAFLSLRTYDESAKTISYPLYEIDKCARQLEAIFANQMPITYKAFLANGRQAP